jgi:long-subunit fatty acid transport protein
MLWDENFAPQGLKIPFEENCFLVGFGNGYGERANLQGDFSFVLFNTREVVSINQITSVAANDTRKNYPIHFPIPLKVCE